MGSNLVVKVHYRLGSNSLDKDNQQAYQHRADVWEDKTEECRDKIIRLDEAIKAHNTQNVKQFKMAAGAENMPIIMSATDGEGVVINSVGGAETNAVETVVKSGESGIIGV